MKSRLFRNVTMAAMGLLMAGGSLFAQDSGAAVIQRAEWRGHEYREQGRCRRRGPRHFDRRFDHERWR